MLENDFPKESLCPVFLFHNFVRLKECDDAIIDICVQCNKKEITKKKDGSIDNKAYGKSHFRDFLQPIGRMKPYYIKIYGLEAYEKSKELRQDVAAADYRKRSHDSNMDDLRREMRKEVRTTHYS